MNIISIIRTVCALSVVTATSQLDVSQEAVDDASVSNKVLLDELIRLRADMRNMNIKFESDILKNKIESSKRTVQIENRVLSLENEQSNMNSSISVIQEDQTEMTNGLEDLKNEMANSFDEVRRNITEIQKTQCCAGVTKDLEDLKKRVDAIELKVIPTAIPTAIPTVKYMISSSYTQLCPAGQMVSEEECKSPKMLAFLRMIAPTNSWLDGNDVRFLGTVSHSHTNPACSVNTDGMLYFNTNKSGREKSPNYRSICKTG